MKKGDDEEGIGGKREEKWNGYVTSPCLTLLDIACVSFSRRKATVPPQLRQRLIRAPRRLLKELHRGAEASARGHQRCLTSQTRAVPRFPWSREGGQAPQTAREDQRGYNRTNQIKTNLNGNPHLPPFIKSKNRPPHRECLFHDSQPNPQFDNPSKTQNHPRKSCPSPSNPLFLHTRSVQ